MSNDIDTLREIERLLCEAEAKLDTAGTFRQRTLLQMALFEVRRGLCVSQRRKEEPSPMATDSADSSPVTGIDAGGSRGTHP